MKLVVSLILVFAFFFVSGCAPGSLRSFQEEDLDSERIVLDIFSARGFLGGSEYERYYLEEDLLWRECGRIKKNPSSRQERQQRQMEGDEYLPSDPNLSIEERRVENLSPTQANALRTSAKTLLSSLESESSKEQPAPGSVFSVTEPGLLELNMELGYNQKRVITSVDAVAEGETKSMKLVKELYSALRGVGPVICQSKTFFGISRKQL